MIRKTAPLLLLTATLVALPVATAHEEGHSVIVEAEGVVVEVEGPEMLAPASEAPSVPPAPVEVHVAHAPPAVECCPIQVVAERSLLSAKRAYRCYGGPIHQTLCVDNPADCCHKLYAVPVCVPACCTGQPVCCGSTVGLLGRGIVTYRWPCGFEAVLTFRVHGGVLITYR